MEIPRYSRNDSIGEGLIEVLGGCDQALEKVRSSFREGAGAQRAFGIELVGLWERVRSG